MASPEGFKALQGKVQEALVKTVKSANQIASEDLPFHRTVDTAIGDNLDTKTERMLALSSKLLKAAAQATGQDEVPSLDDADDVEMNWRKIVDVLDSVLERADRAMDEFTGALKRKDAPATDNATAVTKKPKTMLANSMRHANMTKPQLSFERPIDNNTVWEPVLTKKPNATVPLEQSVTRTKNESGIEEFSHPYESEILQSKYPDFVYEDAKPILYKPVQSTTATFVDTYEGVLEMLKELKKVKEIAVDLEHHDTRTYAGLLSLMQISTREKDWIVDTLKPWRHQLEILNEVFTDPSILKVFHGSHSDMQWLQRDLGLYINGLFDTYFASETLHYPQRSLAYLLKRFVDFDADKKYQMADWRIRPIPEEMFYYARSDTHYLLYIYDLVRNELVKASDRTKPETDYIEQVLRKSKELSLSRYEGAHLDPETGRGSRGWYNLLLRNPMPLSGQQFAVYKAVWNWRDKMARSLDESTGYVLPNAVIGEIAKNPPPDGKALHGMIPVHSFTAKRNVDDIWKAVQKAMADGVNGPSLYEYFRDDPAIADDKRTRRRVQHDMPSIPDDSESGTLPGSQLFSNVPLSTRWEPQPAPIPNERVLLPWQRRAQLTGIPVVEDVDMTEETTQPAAPSPVAPKPEEEDSLDEEFTLKAGQKRKAPENDPSSEEEESESEDTPAVTTTGEASSVDEEIEIEDEEELAEKERRARKAAKREAKAGRKAAKAASASKAADSDDDDDDTELKQSVVEHEFADVDKAEKKRRKEQRKLRKETKAAKKAAAAAAKAEEQQAESEEAFDYTNATSVLHAKRGNNDGSHRGKKRFDPYRKSEDNDLKGARKLPPLHGNRSATFKK
ncbi:ribonuclease H-like domain-containing protein [Plectosphaerella plurivora]|uniref:Ribonuclease H-like domain-containing protein n=1 Tax=Plectosphaerella plurivora TaxID=936078 RepID=A0A9P9ABK7_9PEZI|nr:ribonuclease H-like domain-containing protein [Plectosphaerella plurivora]